MAWPHSKQGGRGRGRRGGGEGACLLPWGIQGVVVTTHIPWEAQWSPLEVQGSHEDMPKHQSLTTLAFSSSLLAPWWPLAPTKPSWPLKASSPSLGGPLEGVLTKGDNSFKAHPNSTSLGALESPPQGESKRVPCSQSALVSTPWHGCVVLGRRWGVTWP